MTTLTTEQQQRMEALNSAALLLVDRSESSGHVLVKGSTKTSGLIPAIAEHRHLHIVSATFAAIELAEYVISGPEPTLDVTIDEDGMRVGEKS